MRHMMHVLREIGDKALRRYTDHRLRALEQRRADMRQALEMFDYDASDDPC